MSNYFLNYRHHKKIWVFVIVDKINQAYLSRPYCRPLIFFLPVCLKIVLYCIAWGKVAEWLKAHDWKSCRG